MAGRSLARKDVGTLGKPKRFRRSKCPRRVILQPEHTRSFILFLTGLSFVQSRHRGPKFGSLFLLNHISYYYPRLVLKPTLPGPVDLVTKPAADVLVSAFRTTKAGHFDANFSPFETNIERRLREGKGVWKATTKEKYYFRTCDLFAAQGKTSVCWKKRKRGRRSRRRAPRSNSSTRSRKVQTRY